LRAKAPWTRASRRRSKARRLAQWAHRTAVRLLCARARGRERPQRFLARLGHEADDALDEFLNRALDYERRETPSLQGFIAWLRAARTDIKRDMEITRDEVRVMTVHGAKAWRRPIVILADTTTPPPGRRSVNRGCSICDVRGRSRPFRVAGAEGQRRAAVARGPRARAARERGRACGACST
jgi:ATP-dependent exoDNAse (exonuclease V) beta subunit